MLSRRSFNAVLAAGALAIVITLAALILFVAGLIFGGSDETGVNKVRSGETLTLVLKGDWELEDYPDELFSEPEGTAQRIPTKIVASPQEVFHLQSREDAEGEGTIELTPSGDTPGETLKVRVAVGPDLPSSEVDIPRKGKKLPEPSCEHPPCLGTD